MVYFFKKFYSFTKYSKAQPVVMTNMEPTEVKSVKVYAGLVRVECRRQRRQDNQRWLPENILLVDRPRLYKA